jgi:hypothetical protein
MNEQDVRCSRRPLRYFKKSCLFGHMMNSHKRSYYKSLSVIPSMTPCLLRYSVSTSIARFARLRSYLLRYSIEEPLPCICALGEEDTESATTATVTQVMVVLSDMLVAFYYLLRMQFDSVSSRSLYMAKTNLETDGTESTMFLPRIPEKGNMVRNHARNRKCIFLTIKCEKFVGSQGYAPDPAGKAHDATPDPLVDGDLRLRRSHLTPAPKNIPTPLTEKHIEFSHCDQINSRLALIVRRCNC